MKEEAFSVGDLALLADLERAADRAIVEPCLIGARAIRLGPALAWDSRPRATRDWDFAVRLDSMQRYEELAGCLTDSEGGFEKAREAHRFRHRSGGILDVVPYGELEDPRGYIRWEDGQVMDTRGLHVLDRHHHLRRIGTVQLRIASSPAIVGLKILSYVARRPGVTRDIGDVHRILVEADERDVEADRLDERVYARLAGEEVSYGELGSYSLGREVGRIFSPEDHSLLRDLVDEARDEESPVVPDILRAPDAAGRSRKRVLERLAAFRLGLEEEGPREPPPSIET